MKNNKQRNGFSVWEILGGLALVLVGAALVFPMVARPHHPHRGSSCLNNLKQIGLAVMQYNQDYDEYLPHVSASPKSTILDANVPFNKQAYGWADVIYPYLKNMQCFQCPTESNRGVLTPTSSGFTDYWLNSNVSGVSTSTLDTKQIIMVGDGNDGKDLTDARYNYPSLPAAWIKDKNSPAHRHLKGANYAFLDGHVKMFTPDQITNEPTANGKPTFAVK